MKTFVFCFVPLQDFTASSDIDWSKPISDIDQQLYAECGLTESEQKFIESMINRQPERIKWQRERNYR